MRIAALLPPLAALALGGCATSASLADGTPPTADRPELVRLLEGRAAGQPRQCLSAFERRDSQTFNGTMVFQPRSKTLYRNDLNGCPQLTSNAIPIFRSPSSTLCSGEIVQIVDRASQFPVGACSLGPFVPYTRVATQ